VSMKNFMLAVLLNKNSPSGDEVIKKKRQADYIAPLNHLLLLPSGPGRVQQELVV
jgi:hypothetical protein